VVSVLMRDRAWCQFWCYRRSAVLFIITIFSVSSFPTR